METTDAFAGLTCRGCGEHVDPASAPPHCPDCGGFFAPVYDHGAIEIGRSTLDSRPDRSAWRYRELLPFPPSSAVTMGEGGTPLASCPDRAAAAGVGELLLKDEGRNPTGSIRDRGASVAITAARERDADGVALPTTGDGGQAASAYAARAGLESEAFVPSRAGFSRKAMVNVHGGDMTVVEGRIDDAVSAFEEARADADWHSAAPFETPYRVEGAKTAFFEAIEALDWEPPDAIVVPTGWGITPVAAYRAATDLRDVGLVDRLPPIYVAQAEGCAPIVEARESGAEAPRRIERPDTICGAIEVADPPAGDWVLEALAATGGGAVAIEDEAILEAATALAATEGIEASVAGGAALAGVDRLAERGAFGSRDTVVVLNPGAGEKDADVLRSHLVRKGV